MYTCSTCVYIFTQTQLPKKHIKKKDNSTKKTAKTHKKQEITNKRKKRKRKSAQKQKTRIKKAKIPTKERKNEYMALRITI